jgi:hypothetical protein
MWTNARKDLDTTMTQTLNAFDEKSGTCSNNGWTITFTVIEAIAIIAAVPTAGTSLAPAPGTGHVQRGEHPDQTSHREESQRSPPMPRTTQAVVTPAGGTEQGRRAQVRPGCRMTWI